MDSERISCGLATGKINTSEAIFKGRGLRASRVKKTVLGLKASFVKAKRHGKVFIT